MSTDVQPFVAQKPVSIGGLEGSDFSLRYLLGVLRRNRFLVLASLLTMPILSWLIGSMITPVYNSTLLMRIDEKNAGIPVLEALNSMREQGGEFNTEMQTLRSRTLAELTVDSLALQVSATTPPDLGSRILTGRARRPTRGELLSQVQVTRAARTSRYRLERKPDFTFDVTDLATQKRIATIAAGELVTLGDISFILSPAGLQQRTILIDVKPFAAAVSQLSSRLTISRPNRDANLGTISFQSNDAELAAAVPNVLAANFLALRNQTMKTEARSTVSFLRQQIDTLAKQLAATEDALRAFREGNQVVNLTAEGSVRVSELTRLQAERGAKMGERDALQRALNDARQLSKGNGDSASPFRSLVAFPTLIGTSASQFLQSLNDAENQRALLLQRRTRQDRDVQVLSARIRELEAQLTQNVQAYLTGLTSQIASLDAALARYGAQMGRIPSKEMQFVRLERQNKVLADIYMLLQTRLQEAQIAQATEDSRVRVVDAALIPSRPIKPNRLQYLVFGGVMGLAVGLGLALLGETLDRSVHTREEMTELTGAVSLGIIPHIDLAGQRIGGGRSAATPGVPTRIRTVAIGMAGNPSTEAYRNLRTNITYSRPDKTLKTLVFTSPTPGDGKSTTAANLASTLAHQGLKVLLVDGDMRRGTVNEIFDLSRDPGLSNVLVGASTLDECIRHVDLAEYGVLDVLSCGIFPPNPSELFASQRMSAFIEEAERRYDVTIFDSPPVTLVTDAAILGTMTDGVVLIARAGHTDKGALVYAAELLRNVRAPIIGTVLNDFDFRRDIRYSSYGSPGQYYYSSYGYGYRSGENGYGSDVGSKPPSRVDRLRQRLGV